MSILKKYVKCECGNKTFKRVMIAEEVKIRKEDDGFYDEIGCEYVDYYQCSRCGKEYLERELTGED